MNIKRILYTIIQCTYGILQTSLGFVMFLIHIKRRHYLFHGAIVTEIDSLNSVSLGLFIFVTDFYSRNPSKISVKKHSRLVVHEYGHTIQSLLLGPLYLLVIGIPSLTWAIHPYFVNRRKKDLDYSDFYTESWANSWGEKVTGLPSIGKEI